LVRKEGPPAEEVIPVTEEGLRGDSLKIADEVVPDLDVYMTSWFVGFF
jgi:hypothetical protein